MNNAQVLTHEYLTVYEIRSYLNISKSAAYELVHRKDFPICRFGGTLRVPREPFLMWVSAKTHLPSWLVPVA